ncbi:MAG: hypothetical protein M3271_11865 [Actinomycetota bacterium]|nr:hypothetical protein [Actinomycetota bacterium]
MRRLLLVACLALAACTPSPPEEDAGAPTTPPPTTAASAAPTEDPALEPACPNEVAVVADESLQTAGEISGDVDGDGTDESVTIFFDRAGEDGCQAFVVARSGEEIAAAGPLETWRSDFGLPMPTLNSLREVDGEPGLEVVVNMGAGASTQFVGIVTAEGGALRQVTSDVPDQAGEGLFGVGGSVGHLEAVDCADDGRLVASFAAPAGAKYRVERRFLVFRGTELVADEVEVERVRIERLNDFPEYAAAPFGSCSD